MSQLPPGFELDAPVAAPAPAIASAMGLPEGFEIDGAPAAAPPAPAAEPHTFTLSNILKGLYNSAVSGATLPRDVYQGKVDPSSDEALTRSLDLAGLASPLTPASKGALAAPSAAKGVAEAAVPEALAGAKPTASEIAAAGQSVGVDIPRVALMPNYVQKLGAGLSDLPIVGKPLQASAEKSLQQAGERVGDIAGSIGTVSRDVAGTGLQEGVAGFKTETLPALQREAYAPVKEAISPTEQFAPVNTAMALVEINKRLSNSGGVLTGEAARVADLIKRGKLNFEAIQDVRSALGKQMNDPLSRSGYDDFADSRLYGALSKDLEDATRTVGGDELAGRWQAANQTAKEGQQQFKDVKAFANPNTSPNSAFEQVYGLAMDRRGNLDRLYQVKKTLPAEAWSDISATALDRMGRNNNEQFSMQTFVSSYDKMAPSARKMMFGEASKSVDDLATSFRALQGIERFKSKSQSANPTALIGMGAGATAALTANPVAAVIGGLSTYAGSNWLAKPATVEALAKYSKTYEILVRRPSAGLIKQADQQARRLGVVLLENGTAPEAANDVVKHLFDASRTVIGPPRGAAASGELQEQNQQQR